MKDKIITLKNGKELLIVDIYKLNGIDYCLVCEVVNDNTTDVFGVIRIDEINGKRTVTVIEDESILNSVFSMAEKKYNV